MRTVTFAASGRNFDLTIRPVLSFQAYLDLGLGISRSPNDASESSPRLSLGLAGQTMEAEADTSDLGTIRRSHEPNHKSVCAQRSGFRLRFNRAIEPG